jgi:signal transduction histidine kinase
VKYFEKYLQFSSLRIRLGLLILMAILPMLGLLLYSYLEERNVAISNVEGDVQQFAASASVFQEQLIEGTRQLLVALAKQPGVQEQDALLCSRHLAEMSKDYSRYANLGVLNLEGEPFCLASTMPEPEGFSSQPWFQQTIENRDFVISDGRGGYTSGRVTLNLSYPVTDQSGKVSGVVFAALDLDQLNQITGEVQLPDETEFFMLNRKGIILAYLPDPEKWVGKALRDPPLIGAILNKGQDIVEFPGLDGTRRLYAFTPVRSTVETGLYVCFGIPTAVAFSDANETLVRHLIGLGSIMVVALLVVWFGSDVIILRPVNALVGAAKRLSSGDMKARTGLTTGTGELDHLARAFDEMAEALEQQATRLLRYQEQLRSLTSELSLAEERERRRIATDLHDRVGQALAVSKMKLGALREASAGGGMEERIDDIRDLIEQAIRETRSLIFEISSPILYELGFEAAVGWLAEEMEKQHAIRSLHRDDGHPKPLDDDIRVLLFQAVNELLINVAKHARANQVEITTERDGGRIRVVVEDNGNGWEPSEICNRWGRNQGFGLFSIRERLKHVDGSLDVESRPGIGTRITVTAPLKDTGLQAILRT